MKNKKYLLLIIVLILIVIDQLIKFVIARHLDGSNDIILINDVLELSYVENTGVAFGLRIW